MFPQLSRTFSAQSAARIPMIKFRKGGLAQKSAPVAAPAGGGGAAPTQQKSAGASTYVYDMENMPMRFRRQLISQEECDVINGGGISMADPPAPPKKKK